MDEGKADQGLSKAEARAIAKRLIDESHARPPASPPAELSSPQHELSRADENRVEEALVELGAVAPESVAEDNDVVPNADHGRRKDGTLPKNR